jgi:hypothetical protein
VKLGLFVAKRRTYIEDIGKQGAGKEIWNKER